MARIALDCRSVFPCMGGIGRHTANLARALAGVDGRNEYVLVFTHRKGESALTATETFRELSFEAGMIDQHWEQLQLPTVLSDNDIELYHNTCFSLPVVQTTRWRIATVHDVVFRVHPGLVDPGLCDYLDRWTEHSLDAADSVITVSEFSKGEIVRAYGTPPEKIHVIYNGVEARFDPTSAAGAGGHVRGKYNLPDSFVLYVGALEPKKNIDRLLAAFALLVKSGEAQGRKLVLAGGRGGRDYDAKTAIARAGIAEHVLVTGYVDDEDMVSLLQAADLFVYPSLYEGFGLPPLEAMACGVPTVVSDATSLPEVVGEGALIAPAEDVGGLAETMARGLRDETLRRQLADRGRRRAAEFTWERAAQQTLALYDAVIGGAV